MTDERMLLTKEQIWEVQQGNSDWEDDNKGLAVAKAQLAKAIPLIEAKLVDKENLNYKRGFKNGQEQLKKAGWEVPHEVAARVAKIVQANNDQWNKLREQARQDERKAIGDWMEQTLIEAGLSADLFHGFQALKSGKRPEGE